MVWRPAYLAIGGAVALLAVVMAGLLGYAELSTTIASDAPLVVEVRQGETLRQFTRRLAEQGALQRPRLVTMLGILRGDSANIKAGEYVLQGRVSPSELLDYLVSGQARYAALTVPEGFNLEEIAERLEERALGRGDVFLTLAHDPGFIASLHLPIEPAPPSLEGFLYPDTYFFYRGASEAALIAAMVNEFRKRALEPLRQQAGEVGLTPYQALILASIVEKETAVPGERELIAAVFHNRLRARMRLGSDPTVIYGLRSFDGNLRRVDLLTETPYNTYKILGLPPTPIANPGRDSIRATVAPAKVDYLYFVAKGDGTHVFSRDYRTHSRAVWKYQIRPHRKRNS